MNSFYYLLIFPGFLFLSLYGLLFEFIDRKLYARFQNRQGPPWFQPLADFIKLSSKEEIIPEGASPLIFRSMPIVSLAAVVTSALYIPFISTQTATSFTGDLIVVLYLLTLPTISFFLAGWYSTSLYATIGASRTLTQLFAYEVPLFMALLAPAILANSWTVREIAVFYGNNPLLSLINIPAFLVSLIALQGKLERVPFDLPEAETEIVGGTFTEYTGRLLALFRLTVDFELVVGISLLAAIFIPVGHSLGFLLGLAVYFTKTLFILFLLSVMRSVVARLRIEQMVVFCWKWIAPITLIQILINVFLLGIR